PAMDRFLARADELPRTASQPDADGGAIGHLLHADPDERFHVLSVVFPPGTSSGTHEHGCWGIIGYVAGLDEETGTGAATAAPATRSACSRRSPASCTSPAPCRDCSRRTRCTTASGTQAR